MEVLHPVSTLPLSFFLELVQMLESRVASENLEAHVDVQHHTVLLHDEPWVETGPHLDVVLRELLGLLRVEALGTDALEAEAAHHAVEEDLQEAEVVLVGRLHGLDPDELTGVVHTFFFSLESEGLTLHVGEEAVAPEEVELHLLLDLVSALAEDRLLESTRVVRDFRGELDVVLLDALDLRGVELEVEEVGEDFLSPSEGLGLSLWSGCELEFHKDVLSIVRRIDYNRV